MSTMRALGACAQSGVRIAQGPGACMISKTEHVVLMPFYHGPPSAHDAPDDTESDDAEDVGGGSRDDALAAREASSTASYASDAGSMLSSGKSAQDDIYIYVCCDISQRGRTRPRTRIPAPYTHVRRRGCPGVPGDKLAKSPACLTQALWRGLS